MGKRRLSFHEKHALETLPKTIASLQATIRALHARLDDAGLYARDRKSFDEASAALVAAQAELAAAEEKWLELKFCAKISPADDFGRGEFQFGFGCWKCYNVTFPSVKRSDIIAACLIPARPSDWQSYE